MDSVWRFVFEADTALNDKSTRLCVCARVCVCVCVCVCVMVAEKPRSCCIPHAASPLTQTIRLDASQVRPITAALEPGPAPPAHGRVCSGAGPAPRAFTVRRRRGKKSTKLHRASSQNGVKIAGHTRCCDTVALNNDDDDDGDDGDDDDDDDL